DIPHERLCGRRPYKHRVPVRVDQARHERAPVGVDDGCLLRGRDVATDLLDLVADDEDGRARGELVRLAVEHLHVLEQGRARLFRVCIRRGVRDGPGLLRSVWAPLRRWFNGPRRGGEEAEEPTGRQYQCDPCRGLVHRSVSVEVFAIHLTAAELLPAGRRRPALARHRSVWYWALVGLATLSVTR